MAAVVSATAAAASAVLQPGISPATLFTALWVPTILAVIGFVINGYLQRSADGRKFTAETARQQLNFEHDRRVLRAMLIAELESLVAVYQNELRDLTELAATYIPAHFFSNFNELTKTLGLLSSKEVRQVMSTYYVYLERTGYIRKNGSNPSAPISDNTIPYDLAGERRSWLENDLSVMVRSAREAIETLEREL